MIVLSSYVVGMATTFIQIDRFLMVVIQMSINSKSINGLAYHGCMLILLFYFFGRSGNSMVVVATVRIYMSSMIIYRGKSMCCQNSMSRGWGSYLTPLKARPMPPLPNLWDFLWYFGVIEMTNVVTWSLKNSGKHSTQ